MPSSAWKKKWKDIVESKALNFHHDNKPDAVCIIPYTSGSTGIPKGCIHTHRTVNAVINAYANWLPIPKKSRVLTTLPLFHVTGMQNSMNVPIFNGNTIVLMTRWDIDTALFLSLIHISEPTRLGMISYAVFCLKKKMERYSRI